MGKREKLGLWMRVLGGNFKIFTVTLLTFLITFLKTFEEKLHWDEIAYGNQKYQIFFHNFCDLVVVNNQPVQGYNVAPVRGVNVHNRGRLQRRRAVSWGFFGVSLIIFGIIALTLWT